MTDPVAELLAGVVGSVRDLTRLSGGASRQTWAFDTDDGPMILQRGAPGPERLGVPAQAALMRAAADHRVPVPRVIETGQDWAIFERVDGETIARRILRDAELAGACGNLVPQAAHALARIHSIEPPSGLPETDQLEAWRAILDATAEPRPVLELGLRWLTRHRPEPFGRALVHGDFRLGNWVVGPDGLRAVLDWELAHIGDPLEDLGWMCVKAWRFGGAGPVAGLAEREVLWRAYEDTSGRRIDPDAARWWELFGTVRWGIICLVQAGRHLNGTERSVELVTIGRRVTAVEWDVMELLS